MKINEKYTAEQKEALERAIAVLALMGAGNAPETQEEFDAWCDAYIERAEAEKALKAKRKAEREAREAIPGYNARRNWKRHDTEIRKAEKEIERLKRVIAHHEKRKAEYAKEYKEETGKEIGE